MKIISVFFSPTNSTRQYVQTVTSNMDAKIQTVDITLPKHREQPVLINDELIILGFPVYGMRIPKPALDYFSRLNGNGNPLAVILVYGNIDTGIVFKQVERMASEQNFHLVGVSCFVAQHAYSTDEYPVAAGRPTSEDLACAQRFGEKLASKIEAGIFFAPVLDHTLIPTAIVKAPYSGTRRLLVQPNVNRSLCNHCNRCIKQCPAGAIKDDLQIIEGKCLRCLSCVRNCPTGARQSHFRAKWMGRGFAWLGQKNHPNQFFL
jgi:ferredoxin